MKRISRRMVIIGVASAVLILVLITAIWLLYYLATEPTTPQLDPTAAKNQHITESLQSIEQDLDKVEINGQLDEPLLKLDKAVAEF